MLGVIFGVGAVIAMLSIGNGAQYEAIEQIKSFGANNIKISALELNTEQQEAIKRTTSKGLSYEDSKYIKKILPYVDYIAPQNFLDKDVQYKQFKPETNIVGTTNDYPFVSNVMIDQGRFITNEDIEKYRKVCILGYDVNRSLFLQEDPIGKFITIGGVRFRVIGTLKDKQKTKQKVKIKSRNINKDIYIPITTSIKKFTITFFEVNQKNKVDYNVIDQISLRVSDSDQLLEAKENITKILNRRHDNIKGFEIIVPLELLEQTQKTQKLFNLVMACIAGLSLLVGGIGIMNIMLASVTERTKEIGIKRAIGASSSDIMLFFLLESILISIIGGILGIIVGVSLGEIVNSYTGWKTIISPDSIILSFGVSSVVGIFFGIYPAYLASKMDPIQALKRE